MAEGPYPKLQRLEAPQYSSKASKFYYHFMYKAVIVSLFIVIVPLLSSQAELVNQNFHARSRELLQLIFVGIAVSYGLFSKRNEDSEKESSSTFDNAHSYVSKLLQVSSVFDDENEKPSAFDDINNIQTWDSQYYRGEPMVVIAKEDYVRQEQRTTSSFIGEKPLLLPVRSLTSRISEAHTSEPIQTGSSCRLCSRSDWLPNNADKSMSPLNVHKDMEQNVVKHLGSKGLSWQGKQTRNQESGGLSTIPNMEATETTMVHPSPIPGRTRSGRMVFEDDINDSSSQNSGEDCEFNKLKSSSLFKSLSSLSSRIDPNPPSPNKEGSPPLVTSRSGEAQEKRIEDFLRKNSFNKCSPQPQPPSTPPPPPYLNKSSLSGSGSKEIPDQIRETRELRRRVKSAAVEFNPMDRVEVPRRVNSSSEFRTANQNDQDEFRNDFNKQEQEKWSKAIEEFFGDKKEFTNKMVHEKFPSESRQTSLEPPNEEETKEFIEKDVVDEEEDDETESEDDFFDGNIGNKETGKEVVEAGASEDCNVDRGPDVDKKADEFIAKFREQIRLQRIHSIRLSSTPYP